MDRRESSTTRKRARTGEAPEGDDNSTYLDFMSSLTRERVGFSSGTELGAPVKSLAPLCRYLASSTLLADGSSSDRSRCGAGSQPSSERRGANGTSFMEDCKRMREVPDSDLELMLGECVRSSSSHSDFCKLAFRAAAAGLNVALLSASPSAERSDTTARLFAAVCDKGIAAMMLHATAESLCCFPSTSARACALSTTVGFALGLGTSLDILPAAVACRILAERAAGHLFERLRLAGVGAAMLFIEDVFSVSRSALSRASEIVAHMMKRPTLAWGGLQVVVSGCPISSTPPLQTRRGDDVCFLPMSVEWAKWFPVVLSAPLDPMLNDRLRQVLTSDVSSTAQARRELASSRFLAPVAGPRYMSAPGVLTIVAFETGAKRKVDEADADARRGGGGVLMHHVEVTLFLTMPRKSVRGGASGESAPATATASRRVGLPGSPEYIIALEKLRLQNNRGCPAGTAPAGTHDEIDSVVASVADARDVGLCAEVRAGLGHLGVRSSTTVVYVGMMVVMLDPCLLRGRVGRVDRIDPSTSEVEIYMHDGEGGSAVVSPAARQTSLMGGKLRMDAHMWPFRVATYLSPRWATHVHVSATLPVHVDPFGFDRTQVNLLAFGAKFPRATYQSCPNADAVYVPQEDMATACAFFEIVWRDGGIGADARAVPEMGECAIVDSHRARSELWTKGFRL